MKINLVHTFSNFRYNNNMSNISNSISTFVQIYVHLVEIEFIKQLFQRIINSNKYFK